MEVNMLKDYSGQSFGLLKAIERFEYSDDDTAITAKWKCLCQGCQKETVISHKSLSSNKKKNCGCGIRTLNYAPGKKYGLLTIVSEAPKDEKSGTRKVYCKCDCGNPELVSVKTNNLVSGNTTSCGCVGIQNRIKHGMSDTRTYRIHEAMIRRCKPHLKDSFPHHAGKGIRVCERWSLPNGEGFLNFLEDMGECPDKLSIDRIDVNGDYTPENCRWADLSVQGYNKGLDPNNSSGKSGVSFYKLQNKWSAEIHYQGKHIRLGMFSNFDDAVKARKEAELKYYGWNKE